MSEIMNGDEINEIERYIPSGNPDALHRPLRNVVASHRALQAKVRELEERLKDRDEQADVREPLIVGQQERILDLEATLRQVEEERDRARKGNDVLRDEMLRLAAKWETRLKQYEILAQERDQLRARVWELEEALQESYGTVVPMRMMRKTKRENES